jgi:hypothetical protein
MLLLTFSANGTSILKWWVDAAFAVHLNMWGHSGGGLFGKRISHCEFNQAESQYSKLYGIGNRRCRRLHAGDLLDSILHGSPRIPSSGQYFVP